MAAVIIIPILIVVLIAASSYIVYALLLRDFLSKRSINQTLEKYNIKKSPFEIIKEYYEMKNESLSDQEIKKIKEIKIINLWVVRQLKNEYNPIHYHDGQLSGVGYLRVPKNMNQNKLVKNKKIKTNGTIDFINGQKNFLSKSIYNLNPKLGDLLIFPNYLMHTAYPFNVDGERRSFSFNVKILFKK